MALSQDMQIALQRATLFALGGAAGLALWGLGENWDNPALSPTLYLALFTFVAVYSGVALALAGPIAVPRALAGALMIALPMTGLIALAGQRHIVATNLLDDPVMMTVAGVLVLVSTPFLMVWLQDRTALRRYAALFDAAWTMTVRYGMAWLFVAVFWLIAFLSDALLDLVDVNFVDTLLRTDWARFGLTGAVLGLGLAVVYELRDTISPYLFLRLLRLLVPVVLAVVAIFLAAVPLRGLDRVFGEFSAAAILMGAALVSITLISTALDKRDADAVSTVGIRMATRGLALLLPLLAGLAVWAVALRVLQYGWTPDRVLAAAAALFLLAYGFCYGFAVVARTDWMRRIRSVNVGMALAVIAVGVLWMTPVLNVYRIATESQVARFVVGHATLAQLPLWELTNDWGKAGRDGLMQLAAMTDRDDHDELVARIEMVRTQPNPFQFDQAVNERATPDRAAELAGLMPVRPERPGSVLTAETFANLPRYRIEQWLTGCNRSMPDGRPGCVMIRGAFAPSTSAQNQAIVLFVDQTGQAKGNHVLLRDGIGISVREVFDPVADLWPVMPPETVQQAQDGAFEIRPSGGKALFIGDAVLVPGN